MRLIDADTLKKDLSENYTFYGFRQLLNDFYEALDSAPSIDIVRCRECKYWKSTVQMPNGTEVKCLYGRKADDFCSYGERSEKPNNLERSSE